MMLLLLRFRLADSAGAGDGSATLLMLLLLGFRLDVSAGGGSGGVVWRSEELLLDDLTVVAAHGVACRSELLLLLPLTLVPWGSAVRSEELLLPDLTELPCSGGVVPAGFDAMAPALAGPIAPQSRRQACKAAALD